MNLILKFLRENSEIVSRDLGETYTEVTKGIIPFFDLLSEKDQRQKERADHKV